MSDAKREWVLRVLGVSVPDPSGSEEGGELDERVRTCARSLDMLRGNSGLGPLATALRTIREQIASGATRDAAGGLDLLETQITELVRASRMEGVSRETAAVDVDFSKLLLRWRAAQGAATEQMEAFGEVVRKDEEVQQDPTYHDVLDVLGKLKDLVPTFGNELDGALHAMGNESDPQRRETLMRAAQDVVARYADELADASDLEEMVQVAQQFFGVRITAVQDLHSALDAILDHLV